MEADFNTVWQRVTGAETQKSEAELLEELILRKGKDIAVYQTLRQRFPTGNSGIVFRQLEQEEREQRRKLQTYYYLMTGDSVTMRPEPPLETSSLLRTLRICYNREQENAGLLYSLSLRFRQSALHALCTELSEQDTAHAQKLYEIAERIL